MERKDKILNEVYESIKKVYSVDNLIRHKYNILSTDEKGRDFAYWEMKRDLGEQYTVEELSEISEKIYEIFDFETFKKIVNGSSKELNIPDSFQSYVRSRYFLKLNRGIGRGERRRPKRSIIISYEPIRVCYPSGNGDYKGRSPEPKEFHWTPGSLIGFN